MLSHALTLFAKDIKIAHSIFAIPFAAAALWMAPLPVPTLWQGLLLAACMVCARSFAMGMNRILDADLDALNPRTATRQIPSGNLRSRDALILSLAFGAGFVVAAAALSPTAGMLAPLILVILGSYPLCKRFTFLTHYYLGMCLGLAPMGVWVALRSTPPPGILVALGGAVTLWTAGFDILYATQDLAFDRRSGLHSIPQRLGPRRAVWVSATNFIGMLSILLAVGHLGNFAWPYSLALCAIAAILATEVWMVHDLDPVTGHAPRLHGAFFTANAWVSVVYLTGVVAAHALGRAS